MITLTDDLAIKILKALDPERARETGVDKALDSFLRLESRMRMLCEGASPNERQAQEHALVDCVRKANDLVDAIKHARDQIPALRDWTLESAQLTARDCAVAAQTWRRMTQDLKPQDQPRKLRMLEVD